MVMANTALSLWMVPFHDSMLHIRRISLCQHIAPGQHFAERFQALVHFAQRNRAPEVTFGLRPGEQFQRFALYAPHFRYQSLISTFENLAAWRTETKVRNVKRAVGPKHLNLVLYRRVVSAL